MAEQRKTTLLIRHLPSDLSLDEKRAMLHHLGATQVKVFGNNGHMKNAAVAVFSTEEQAKEIISQLHQVEFLGSTLVVQYALSSQDAVLPSVMNNEGVSQTVGKDMQLKEEKKDSDADHTTKARKGVKFDCTFSTWDVKYPRRPDLYYQYPPPTPSILTNIVHSLAAVPKFYVQVLHLMNKMDLPPPFGVVTSTPPFHLNTSNPVAADDVKQKEMDISSSAESELESDDGEKRHLTTESRAKRGILKRQLVKRQLLLKDLQHPEVPDEVTSGSGMHIPVSEVFETHAEGQSSAKKIALNIPSSIHSSSMQVPPFYGASLEQDRNAVNLPMSQTTPATSAMEIPPASSKSQETVDRWLGEPSHEEQTVQAEGSSHYVHPAIGQEPETQDLSAADQPSEVTRGFGILHPVQKEKRENIEMEGQPQIEWGKGKFVTSSQLKHSRLSKSEMQELSVFRHYSEGQPSCRLYIKNVSKQATEEDLHFIYGRYVDWDEKTEAIVFDIRLMKEGRMKGQAFVTLPSEASAAEALCDTNGYVLKGKPMVVQFARSAKGEEDKSSTKGND